MGLSSFWASIKGPRSGKVVAEKHLDNIYAQHHQVPPNNTHVALSNDETVREQPSRVDSAAAKKLKRRSFMRTKEPSLVSSQEPMPLSSAAQKQANRRSLWRSESELNTGFVQLQQEPEMPQSADEMRKSRRRSLFRSQSEAKLQQPNPQPTGTATSQSTPDKKLKRRSFWQSESQSAVQPIIAKNDTAERPTEDKLARRLSWRLSTSSKKSRRSSRSRLSIFGGGADLDSEDDVPAMPAIPHTLADEKRRDQGSAMGLPDNTVVPGTALTSDDTYSTAHNVARANTTKPKRFSLSRQKSTTSTQSSKKNRRRSWLPGSSNPIDSSTPSPAQSRSSTSPPPLPIMPALTPDSLTSTSKDPFENFLLNSHRYSRHTSQPYHDLTDFDRFLKETAAFEALGLRATGPRRHSVKAPKAPGHVRAKSSVQAAQGANWDDLTLMATRTRESNISTKRRGSYIGPRNAEKGFISSTSDREVKRESWRRSRIQGDDADMRDPMYCLENGRSEWEKLMSDDNPRADEEGVMGMLRELSDDEFGEEGGRDDALKALECGVAR